MNDNQIGLARHRMQKARSFLEDARILFDNGRPFPMMFRPNLTQDSGTCSNPELEFQETLECGTSKIWP